MVTICFKCKKEIDTTKEYYGFSDLVNGVRIKENFAHKKCWDDFLTQLTTLENAQSMLASLQPALTNMGILPSKEVIIA